MATVNCLYRRMIAALHLRLCGRRPGPAPSRAGVGHDPMRAAPPLLSVQLVDGAEYEWQNTPGEPEAALGGGALCRPAGS